MPMRYTRGFGTPVLDSQIQTPTSSIVIPAPSIQTPASSIQIPTSSIPRESSNVITSKLPIMISPLSSSTDSWTVITKTHVPEIRTATAQFVTLTATPQFFTLTTAPQFSTSSSSPVSSSSISPVSSPTTGTRIKIIIGTTIPMSLIALLVLGKFCLHKNRASWRVPAARGNSSSGDGFHSLFQQKAELHGDQCRYEMEDEHRRQETQAQETRHEMLVDETRFELEGDICRHELEACTGL